MRSRVIKTLILVIYLIFFISFHGCKVFKLDDPDTFDISDVISIAASAETLKANGVDKTKVTATLLGDTADGLLIAFTTDAGRLAGLPTEGSTEKETQEVTVRAAGRTAEVDLISSTKAEIATVSATITVTTDKNSIIYNYRKSTTVKFEPVLPEEIYLETDEYIIKNDGTETATLTAYLRAPNGIGTVTKNTRVIFEAVHVQTGTEMPHLYREASSTISSKGEAVAIVNLASTKAGDFEITCSVPDAEDVSASIIITFATDKS